MGVSETLRVRDWDRFAGVAPFVAFMPAIEVLERVPGLGVVVQGSPLAVGFGAVLLTSVGLWQFEPATIQEVGR